MAKLSNAVALIRGKNSRHRPLVLQPNPVSELQVRQVDGAVAGS